jgi:hypothetical protein
MFDASSYIECVMKIVWGNLHPAMGSVVKLLGTSLRPYMAPPFEIQKASPKVLPASLLKT